MVPMVTMKGGTLVRATRTPLTSPAAMPVRTASRTVSAAGHWAWPVLDSTVSTIAMIPPTDRSIPPVRMTSIWPRATMPTTEARSPMLIRFPELRNSPRVLRAAKATRAVRVMKTL